MVATAKAAAKKPTAAKKKAAASEKGPPVRKSRYPRLTVPTTRLRSNMASPAVPGRRSLPKLPLMKALRAEHRHMATVMQLFSEQLKAIEGGELVDTHVVYEIMDYMVTWPDRFHHPREDLIYARVAEVDARTADDVDSLQRDHDHTGQTRSQRVAGH